MYFTIEKAGILGKRYRARLYSGNNELVWFTQTYSDARDAQAAIDLIQPEEKYPVHAGYDTGKF